MNNKKAQVAIELLSTYGLVLLITLGVLGAMIYFDLFDIKLFQGDECKFYSGLGCLDARITNESVQVFVQNEIGFDISNINLILNSTECNSFANTTQDINGSILENKPYLANSESSLYTIPCDSLSLNKVDGTLTLSFRTVETNQTHQKSGFVKISG